MDRLLISNEPVYVKHFTLYFQDLWDKDGIDAVERIKDVEGMDYDIEVIRSSDRSLKKYFDMVKSAKHEIFYLFPTPRAFIRQLKEIELAIKSSKERVKVRILTPADKSVEIQITQFLKEGSKEIMRNQIHPLLFHCIIKILKLDISNKCLIPKLPS